MRAYDKFCLSLNNLKDIYKYEKPYENVDWILLMQ